MSFETPKTIKLDDNTDTLPSIVPSIHAENSQHYQEARKETDMDYERCTTSADYLMDTMLLDDEWPPKVDLFEQPNSEQISKAQQEGQRTKKSEMLDVRSGNRLNEILDQRDENGKSLYTQANPLRIHGYIQVYVNSAGDRVLTIPGRPKDEIKLQTVGGLEGQGTLQTVNYAIVYQTLYERMEESTQLLLGGANEKGRTLDSFEENIIRANRIAEKLLPMWSTDRIISPEEIQHLQSSFNAITNNKSLGANQIQTDLLHLGIIDQSQNIHWKRLETIGNILREKNYFEEYEQHEFGAYDALKTELSNRR